MSEKIPYEQVMGRMKSDIEYIVDEAYAKGFKMGEQVGSAEAGAMDYQMGLDDAWEAARKIISMPDPPYWGIFGDYKNDLFGKITAREAIAKLKAYEEKKKANERIMFGDGLVTKHGDMKGIALSNEVNGGVYVWREDCVTYEANVKEWKKTGETYPQAYELLKKMKGGEE